MRRRKNVVMSLGVLIALALACGGDAKNPLAPSSGSGGTSGSTTNETLKVGAPTPVSPVNDQQPAPLALTALPPDLKFASPDGLSYDFEVLDAGNVAVVRDTVPSLTYAVSTPLDLGRRYTWHVRAASNGAYGPWSATASFLAPAGGGSTGGDLTSWWNPADAQGSWMRLVQGKTADSLTLVSLGPYLVAIGGRLENPNALGITSKIRLPDRKVVRVGENFDSGPGYIKSWVWVPQG